MLISTSFLSSKNIPKDLEKLNETSTDYIHVDIMDGKFVKNKTMPFSEMKHIYKYTSKRLDVHLMVKDPKKYIDDYATLNTEYITFHLETLCDIESNLQLIRKYGIKIFGGCCGTTPEHIRQLNDILVKNNLKSSVSFKDRKVVKKPLTNNSRNAIL